MDPLLESLLTVYANHSTAVTNITAETSHNRAQARALHDACSVIKQVLAQRRPSVAEASEDGSFPDSQPLLPLGSPSLTPEVDLHSEVISVTPTQQREELEALFPVQGAKPHPKEKHPKALVPKTKRPREAAPKREPQSTPEEYWEIH